MLSIGRKKPRARVVDPPSHRWCKSVEVGVETDLGGRHGSVLGTLKPLIERGQAAGDFRGDVPLTWRLAMLMALFHAASAELHAGRCPRPTPRRRSSRPFSARSALDV